MRPEASSQPIQMPLRGLRVATYPLQSVLQALRVPTYPLQDPLRALRVTSVVITKPPPSARTHLCNGYKRASERSEAVTI